MSILELPYKQKPLDVKNDDALLKSNFFNSLPKELQDICREKIFLLKYLYTLPVNEIGMPQYHAKPDRKLGELKQPNIIYPTNNGNFVHILGDADDERNTYIPIEPDMGENLEKLIEQIEQRMLHHVHDLKDIVDDESKEQAFLSVIDKICTTNASEKVTPNGSINGKNGYVEDVSCSGLGSIFIEHKIFHSVKTAVKFVDMDDLDHYVLRIAERVKKPVSMANPIADAVLPDGSRINIVYGKELTKRGSNFTIRKFADVPLSILELIEFGSLNYQMAAYLSMVIGEGMNLFVSGETASGKTTLLNAVTTFIPPNAKIVSIEDTPELQVPHKNWLQEVVQSTKAESGNEVTMFDLLKAALRQRPNEIIVGEIRGAEGAIAFQAMQTGHAVMATFHAASVQKLIQRLTGNPINVPKTYVDCLNVVAIQSAVKLPNGKGGRRALSINEIVGYDASSDAFSFLEIFKWDPIKDEFEFVGYQNSYLLEQKIAVSRGIPPHQKRRIYSELDKRAKILEKLHKERGITNFYELLTTLSKAQQQGLF
ncbi:MAG: type II/IV secretion system ATPase subunit [Dehalococcoidia bacterium]